MSEISTLSVKELSDQARDQMTAAGVAEPDVAAVRIVAEATGLAPAGLVLSGEHPVTQGAVARTDEMLARRAEGEPLQYVLGHWGFRGLDLAVDRRALIPRPETESVAGVVIDWLKDAARARHEPLLVADLGTGSGAIALSVAQEVPEAVVYATDLSVEALELARENLAGLGRAGARVNLSRGSWFEVLEPELTERLDVVVSNPPYVSDAEQLPPEVADWEPEMALRAGPDGLGDLHALIAGARLVLAAGGLLALECAPDQAAGLAQTLSAHGYDRIQISEDLSGTPRVLTAHRPDHDPSAAELLGAAEAVRTGGFVVAPTDTVCGVLADYGQPEAVRCVYAAKGRPETMPLPLLVSGIEQAERLVMLNDAALDLAQRHWPGALTLVAPRRGGPDPVGGHTTLGVRVPDLGWLRWLAMQAGPLTGTSANCHGSDTPESSHTAAAALLGRAAYIIEGRAPLAVASTVVNVCKREPVVLRQGALQTSDLLRN